MTMTPSVRKFALTVHVTSSVGWLGAVAAFLVLSVAGLRSGNPETVRSAYLAMNLVGEFIIVPLSFAALLTGLIQSLGTHWGFFRHYWVIVKFTLTIGATALLLLHQLTAVSEAARRVLAVPPGTLPKVGRVGTQLAGDAGFAVLVLLVTTTLSVYKPWGRTPYGQSKRQQERRAQERIPKTLQGARLSGQSILSGRDDQASVGSSPLGFRIFLAIIAMIAVAFVVMHLIGRGLGGH